MTISNQEAEPVRGVLENSPALDYSSLDHKTRTLLRTLLLPTGRPLRDLAIPEARQVFSKSQSSHSMDSQIEYEQRVLKCGPKGNVRVWIVRPEGIERELPIVLYCHGGGWVFGEMATYRAFVSRIVREITSCAVVFVEFSRSPENRFPVAVEEIYSVLTYLAERSSTLNLKASPMVIAGDSSGANLATVVALLANCRNGPKLRLQVLLCPNTDCQFDTPCHEQFGNGYLLNIADLKWFWDQYIPDPQCRQDPCASPLRASTKLLRGCAPALILTSEYDVVRDEGEAYAGKLASAGVEVIAIRCLNTVHNFMVMQALAETPAARAARRVISDSIRGALAG